MRLFWPNISYPGGSAFGYHTHITKMAEALTAAGVELREDPAGCDLAVLIAPLDALRGRLPPGLPGIIFTMSGFDPAPARFAEDLRPAAALVVPTEHDRHILAKLYGGPIFCCPEGIDPLIFRYRERHQPGPVDPFVFLWAGAVSPHKGAGVVLEAWRRWSASGKRPSPARLLLKTVSSAGVQDIGDGVTLNGRPMTQEELAEVYGSAHAAILPSLAEGWGLQLCECLAMGTPCAWTAWGAPRFYAYQEIGFPLRYELVGMTVYDEPTRGALADPDQVVEVMERIYSDYGAALERGRLASERMHSRFTWRHAAARFLEILDTVREPVPV